jgi:periplasmic divalent cation tolerance protein
VLTTLGAHADAGAFARALVAERLAACVNIVPVTSIYRWTGNVEEEREQQLVIKTTAGRVAALEAHFREVHPYEVPEFLVLEVSGGSSAYVDWLAEACGHAPRPLRES